MTVDQFNLRAVHNYWVPMAKNTKKYVNHTVTYTFEYEGNFVFQILSSYRRGAEWRSGVKHRTRDPSIVS